MSDQAVVVDYAGPQLTRPVGCTFEVEWFDDGVHLIGPVPSDHGTGAESAVVGLIALALLTFLGIKLSSSSPSPQAMATMTQSNPKTFVDDLIK